MHKHPHAFADKPRWKRQQWEELSADLFLSCALFAATFGWTAGHTGLHHVEQTDITCGSRLERTPKKSSLRYEAESFDIGMETDNTMTAATSGLASKLGSPREEPASLEGCTVRVLGEIVSGMTEVMLEEKEEEKNGYWLAVHAAAPTSMELSAPDFESE